MPSLQEYDSSCYSMNACIYDKDVEDFLAKLLALNPNERMSLKQAYKHSFLSRKVDKSKAVEMWTSKSLLFHNFELIY